METTTNARPKRIRSNGLRVKGYQGQIHSIHLAAERERWTHAQLVRQRAAWWHAVRDTCTASEKQFLWGYTTAMYDATVQKMVWRLGTADRFFPEGTDYAACPEKPTHGSHFWPGTDALFGEWKPL